jgi:hypothetical protein
MSYQPSPAADTSFLNELAAMMLTQAEPDPSIARSFRAKAEQLLKTPDPQTVWVGRAAVAAYEWDIPQVRDIVRRARLAVGNNPDVLINLGVSLEHVVAVEEAHELARAAHLVDPLDVFCFTHRANTLTFLGRWSEAHAVAEQFVSRVGRDQAGPALEIFNRMSSYSDLLVKTGVNEKQVQLELAKALEVFREMRIRNGGQRVFFEEGPYGGAGTLGIRLLFNGDIDLEIRLGAALASRLRKLPGWDPTKLSVDFECLQLEDADITV